MGSATCRTRVTSDPLLSVRGLRTHFFTRRGVLRAVRVLGARAGRLAAIEDGIPDVAQAIPGCAFAPRCSERMVGCADTPRAGCWRGACGAMLASGRVMHALAKHLHPVLLPPPCFKIGRGRGNPWPGSRRACHSVRCGNRDPSPALRQRDRVRDFAASEVPA